MGNKYMGKWKEYKFKIEGFTPDTLPMSRCESYLTELSNILGEINCVHFVRVADGCVQLIHKIDISDEPKVKRNTRAVAMGQGTDVQMNAYRRMNKMLTEDNTKATLLHGKKNVLPFPGEYKEETLVFNSIHQQGEVDGDLILVGGSGDKVPIHLEIEGKVISKFRADRLVAKELAKHMFDPVRLYGEGRWNRNDNGEWILDHFVVEKFEPLKETSLSETISILRQLRGEWEKDSLYEILESRRDHKEIN
jgi:hypothetical protein